MYSLNFLPNFAPVCMCACVSIPVNNILLHCVSFLLQTVETKLCLLVTKYFLCLLIMIIKMVKTWNVVIIGGRVTLCKKDTSLSIWVQNQSIFPLYF